MEPKSVQRSLNALVEGDPMLRQIFAKHLNKEKWTAAESQEVVSSLSDLLWNVNYTCDMEKVFSPLLLELLTRASNFPEEESMDSYARHEWLCICLSKLIWKSPEIGRFTRIYFEKTRNLFWRYEGDEQPPLAKKSKTEAVAPQTYQLLKAGLLFLMYDTPYFKDLWSWSVIVKFLKDRDVKTRWFAYKCISRVGSTKDSNLIPVLEKYFNEEEKQICYKEEFEMSHLWGLKPYFPLSDDVYKKESPERKESITTETVNVCGVLLNRCIESGDLPPLKLVCVETVTQSLSALALAVASSEPALLQGPVGCGKTSLVEHLALMTGRCPSENFIKVQLGDHVDSKMLLGAHVCTEMPGEFVWKPGVLTRAMNQGHWLLLEDIDCAPMDVISLLVPVLQTRTLVLPGHSAPIKAAPSFQLFATKRLLTGLEGMYLEFRNNGEIIDSLFRKILVHSLPRAELKEVISAKWPSLVPIMDPCLLSVYSLFSTDLMDEKTDIDLGDSHIPFNTFCKHGRLISMRDLFKFCDRIAKNFDGASNECAIKVYKNAVECFCDNIPNPETRLLAATAIATQFNLPKAKAEHFCHHYKPRVENTDPVEIGRVFLPKIPPTSISFSRPYRAVFAQTRLATSLLEKVAVSVVNKEPVLLVGETGTGKTSIVQHLAELTNHKLTVINMSQQSDSVDLVGGFKPVDMILLIQPIRDEFECLFRKAMNVEKNAKFLQHVTNCFFKRKYEQLFELILHAESNIVKLYLKKYPSSEEHLELVSRWRELTLKIRALEKQMNSSKTTLAFKFVEGALVKAMRRGEWILLDEINLAEAETLECLAGVLEKDDNELILLEKGENETVTRHPDFHIFACMNPATDVGKKDLPIGIRSRFTEFFVDEMNEERERNDFTVLVHKYLKTLTLNSSVISNVIDFYTYVKSAAAKTLSDGTGQNPHYSLRTLCRALKYASSNPCHNVPRSLYEAFCLSFLSQLDNASHQFVSQAISSRLLEKNQRSVLNQSIPEPGSGQYTEIAGYWIMSGDVECAIQENYIFTETVQRNLRDLARVVSAARYPVLLQGETSCGKTSLIQYLARATGNVCARINNHEHTDIQDYIGTYTSDDKGMLVFKEGILVDAMRKGHWIILDELNLAPTEVMEALNRVLDDNRELFITETQTLVKAHPRFMIFATQNPPGHYGGRKILSRAFRNRFIELHFNEIPPPELEVILEKRCNLPAAYSKRLVAIMQELQVRRRESGVFAGKHGFITLRDLFRWGERYEYAPEPPKLYDWFQHLADEGFLLLSGRVRLEEEVNIIQEAIFKHLKRKADPDLLFNWSENTSPATRDILVRTLQSPLPKEFKNIVWTYNMRRLAVLVGKAMQYSEPVLLVGSTGCGKTSICQLYAAIFETELHSVNCHMHSESADFLGGLRPVRDAKKREVKLFDWVDGPLVISMNDGSFFLADEISLADDSVLERLNSVLEEDQKLFLSEKSLDGCSSYEIVAKDGFQFFATMNPGGDYGKKELSPALRNRFTEIWCPSNMLIESDVIDIVDHNIHRSIRRKFEYGVKIAEFLKFYSETELGRVTNITMRDIITWVEFINAVADKVLSPVDAYLHGAFLVFLDSIGSGNTAKSNEIELQKVKKVFYEFLNKQTGGQTENESLMLLIPEMMEGFARVPIGLSEGDPKYFEIGPFHIRCGSYSNLFDPQSYILKAKTTKANALRLLRAMQLSKPILLEGSPGVGKTSLVDALAKVSGHKLVRINLSEQTDISDLFGADLPVEGGEIGEFAWRDGPLIQALKKGHWILLDELNLASQSVLEGLNACLDHRSEVYISELGMTFPINRTTSRIFGCQNPYRQGGSRKGLPRSFLNRFSQVYVRPMDANDLLFITRHVYSDIPQELLVTMITFNAEVDKLVNEQRACGSRGAPFEFNLRDIFRWCDAINSNQSSSKLNIGEHIKLIYADRMRTPEDKSKIYALYEDLINKQNLTKEHCVLNRHLDLHVYEDTVQLGNSCVDTGGRNCSDSSIACISPGQLSTLESIMKCIEMKWMPILVGPSGSGKSTLVRLLAELTGHQLHVMSVNSEMDTIELLGGFEQVDINRKATSVVQDLEPVLQKAVSQCLQPSALEGDLGRLEDILFQMHLLSNIQGGSDSGSRSNLKCLLKLIASYEDMNLPGTQSILSTCKENVQILLGKVSKHGSTTSGGQFEWVDSILIHALRKGHWLLVDDANFCSPSVLDRLNSLLEPNGVLTVSEQGVVGKRLRVITPHREFRIFLTMNPRNGEISRAMRNRGVEIYIDPVNADLVGWRRCLDTSSFAQCRGLVHSSLIYILTTIHRSLVENSECESPTLSDYLSAATLCGQLIRKHEEPKSALRKSCHMVYVKNNFNPKSRKVMAEIIDFYIGRSPKITQDSNLPLTSFMPSSLDYRHGALFATVKKQTAFFTYFLNHLKGHEGIEMLPLSYPVPDLPLDLSNKEKLFCVLRIMFESTSVELHEILNYYIQYSIESVLKSKSHQNLKEDLHPGLLLKKELMEQLEHPIVRKLLNIVKDVCSDSEFQVVKATEFSIDPRWRPDAYRRLLCHLEKFSENVGTSVGIEMIEFKIASYANKFNLLLLLRTLVFISDAQKSTKLYSLVQTEKVSTLLERHQKKNHGVVRYISAFLENVPQILKEMLEKEAFDCHDNYYWQLRGIFSSFYACRKVCEEGVEDSQVPNQLAAFITHFYSLMRKIRILFPSAEDMPASLFNAFNAVDRYLMLKAPDRTLREKFLKRLGQPIGFCSEEAIQLYISVEEIYDSINLFTYLTSPNPDMNNLKIILSNLGNWMSKLTEQTCKSIFGAIMENVNYSEGMAEVKRIQNQLPFADSIKADDGDEIMEISRGSSMSDNKLLADIQLLPLWDYLFTVFNAELLIISDEKLKFNFHALLRIGTNCLSIHPKHLAYMFGQEQCRRVNSKQAAYLFALSSFFMHMRQGFSSSGLHLLQLQKDENGSSLPPPPLESTTDSVWAKQTPLLSYICSNICSKASTAPLMCQSPLRNYIQKISQLETTKYVLWKNYEKFHDPLLSFRVQAAKMVMRWFYRLISHILEMYDVKLSEELFTKDYILNIFKSSQLSKITVTAKGVDVLGHCIDSYLELKKNVFTPGAHENPEFMWLTSKTYVLVGLLTNMLLFPMDGIDPVLKLSVKVQTLSKQLQDLLNEREIRNWAYRTASGQEFDDISSIASPLYVKGLHESCLAMESKMISLSKRIICRDNPNKLHASKFDSLKDSMETYFSNTGSPDNILDVLLQLDQLYYDKSLKPSHDCIRKSQQLVKNQRTVIKSLNKKFPYYEDIYLPFAIGLEQISYGLELACQCISIKETSLEFQHKHFKTVSEFLSQFVATFSSPFHTACLLLNGENMDAFKKLLAFGNTPASIVSTFVFKLIKSAILEILNEIKLKQILDNSVQKSAAQMLWTAFSYLWNIWNVQEIKLREKKELEESYYVHKTFEGELTDEVKIEKQLASSFPDFKKEFADCIAPQDNDIQEEDDSSKMLTDSEVDDVHLSGEDMFEVWQLHAAAMSMLSTSETKTMDSAWNRHDNKDVDVVTPYLLRHEVVCHVVKSNPDKLDVKLDSVLMDGLILMCNELQKVPSAQDQCYDIYKDPNPAEVITLQEVLNKLDSHLKDLLTEFTDHPQLLHISKLVNRVLSFRITDPIMKFVVGMELILESVQLWEQVAHSKVSLKVESDEIVKKIIHYRAMELDGWRKGLETVIRKQYTNSSKWWFHMFNIITQYKDSENTESFDSLIKALTQCLDDSPLGEFPARLNILQSYLLQAKLSESTLQNKKLSRLLYNLCSYYEQFLPDIKNRILQIRKPIDKGIKDYVKIARWNDINFYAVKSSVEKSHRFVVKHVKEFEDALKVPVKQLFTIPSKKDLTNGNAPPQWSLEIKVKNFLCDDSNHDNMSWVGEREESLIQQMPHYQSKVLKLSKKFAKSFHVVDYINQLNDFGGSIIESIESLTADSGKKKGNAEQEKKLAMQNLQRKKQMLSHLFKELKTMGLSYRHGIIYTKNRNQNDLLIVPAFQIQDLEMLKYDTVFQDMLIKSAQDTSHYFYKSIAQYRLLQTHMETPSQDLTLDVMHRLIGYSGNLVSSILVQKQTIVRVSKMVDRIGCFLGTWSTIKKNIKQDNYILIPPQKKANHHEEMLSSLLAQFMAVLNQFGALLNSAPQNKRDRNEEIPFLYREHSLSNIHKNDSGWSKISSEIGECGVEIEKLFRVLMDSVPATPGLASWSKFFQIVDGFEVLNVAAYRILSVISRAGFAEEQPFTSNLSSLRVRIHNEFDEAKRARREVQQQGKITEVDQCAAGGDPVVKVVMRLTKEVLLSYQDVVAKCVVAEEKEKKAGDGDSDKLFSEKTSKYLSVLEECLRLEKVSKLVMKLKKAIECSVNSVEDLKYIHESLRLLTNLIPFLNQYFKIVKVYFASTLGMHRTSCKFLTILLDLFNTLATKGFCIPAEIKDEVEKSGGTKFEDIEGGGLGEGEGTKDVSDTIESEDQLEDAFKEGEEKKENENESDLKDEKEGIEMSDDFDGKSYNPEENDEESDESGNEDEEEDLDKQMGDVDTEDAEKLDEKVWGSDSEDEDDTLNDEPGESGGAEQNKPSELGAKDGEERESGKDSKSAPEAATESQEDEYKGEVPDPMIDAPPDQEPEVVELPDDMEITDDADKGGSDNEMDDSVEIQTDPEEDSETKEDEAGDKEEENGEEIEETGDSKKKAEEEGEAEDEVKNANTAEPLEDEAEGTENKDDASLPTHTPTTEVQAIPSADSAKSSSQDPVQDKTSMEWESGAQQQEDEQHKEGQADSESALEQGAAHEGQKSSQQRQESKQEQKYKPKLKSPSKKRTLDEEETDGGEKDAKRRAIADKESAQKPSGGSEDRDDGADVYEHVEEKEEGTSKAVDIAWEEKEKQAAIRPDESRDNGPVEEDDEVIELSSDEEEEYYRPEEKSKGRGDAPMRDQRRKPGERGEDTEDIMDMEEGEHVKTHKVSSGESVIYTQHELWASMSDTSLQEKRLQMEKNLDLFAHAPKETQPSSFDMWRSYEILVGNLAQELCEQLRLVLEPTKMAKLKGDYRTGKRLNMRKIIPYIASQFRKDKIWLRRTKASKREYQIMLAIDDSSSMSDNHSKQLAFESFATIGHSLSLLEAGELAVVRFGEKVDLLMGFNEQYNTGTGAKVFEQLSFEQNKTSYVQLLQYASKAMAQARTGGAGMRSRETAQLLVIISDGRGIFSEGEESVQRAVRQARNNNIFTVFVIIDNPLNKDSILDLTSASFVDNKAIIKPYLEKFPFPFYIILRDITSLPLILGEALRQWFELVTSTDR